jgi:hypothetical protein
MDDDDDDVEERPRRKRRRKYEDEDQDQDDYDDDDRFVKKHRGANMFALASYYCGVFALIPGLGCLLAPAAIILAIVGFIKSQSLGGKGLAHSITGAVLGFVVAPVVWVVVFFIVKALGGLGGK